METQTLVLADEEGSSIPGHGQQHQHSRAGDNFNISSGGARRQWWWRSGPVDSCCCCFSLRTGVALLAALRFICGASIICGIPAIVTYLESCRKTLYVKYAEHHCVGSGALVSQKICERIKAVIDTFDGYIQVSTHVPTVVYVLGVFSLVAGLVGFWAVFCRSRRAAGVFTLTWPLLFVLKVLGMLQFAQVLEKYGMDQHASGLTMFAAGLLAIYNFKVSWSYYMKRVEHDHDCSSNRKAGSLEIGLRGNPLLAVNTVV